MLQTDDVKRVVSQGESNIRNTLSNFTGTLVLFAISNSQSFSNNFINLATVSEQEYLFSLVCFIYTIQFVQLDAIVHGVPGTG